MEDNKRGEMVEHGHGMGDSKEKGREKGESCGNGHASRRMYI